MSPSNPTATKVGHGVAKVLGIDLDYRNPTGAERVTRGESAFSAGTADTYVEEEPTSWEWLVEITPNFRQIGQYFYSLFPFLHWITRYNTTWLVGDLIAGITIGAVVVPQGMAYAKLAALNVEYGLYTSFMGVLIYWFFATSKDITIGPVAVLSTTTGTVVLNIAKLHPEFSSDTAKAQVAGALAVVAGGIVCAIGLIRMGWIVDFISLASISAFMTGSALNIAVGQVPSLMGITGFDTRAPTYTVVINILTHLNATKLDAALGFTALFLLYAIRSACNYGTRRFPKYKMTFFFANTLRTIFVILLYTLVSWLVNWQIPGIHDNPSKLSKFTILGTVPRGFAHSGVPTVNQEVVSTFLGDLPSTVIVMIIEHIAIAKSFGRVNGYTINPSQEFVAIGVTNLLAPFLGAYPATGSFSRTAIKAKAGVRTPLAGVITAVVVLIAIYGLTAVFFYIPNSALAAVIIHAVGDLITPPNTVYQFWRISPLEVIIFFAGVLVTVFSGIEAGVYTTMCVSLAVYLWRAFKAQGRFLGRVKVHTVVGDRSNSEDKGKDAKFSQDSSLTRNVYIPIEHGDGSNPEIEVEKPYPGVFIYRFSEGFNYPNANHYLDYLTDHIFANTRKTTSAKYTKLGDRPWNNPGPRRGQPEEDFSHLPELKAVILDFSSVNNVDITSIQNLIDVRNQLDRWAAPNRVAWHFACINNRWTKRALASAGFGYPNPETATEVDSSRWKPIFSVAELGGNNSYAAEADRREQDRVNKAAHSNDVEHGIERAGSESASSNGFDKGIETSKPYLHVSQRVAVVQGLNRPLFHIDLTSALQSAISNIEALSDAHMVTATHGTQDMDLFSQTRIAPTVEEFGKSAHGGHDGGNTN